MRDGILLRTRIIRVVITLILLVCVIFANFYAIRRMKRYGLELFVYDKLLVAYDIGSREGMEKELNEIVSNAKAPQQAALAKRFQARLSGMKDAKDYLKDAVVERRNTIDMLNNLRNLAIYLMVLLFLWRIVINLAGRVKGRK